MNCDEVRERMADLIYSELPGDPQQKVEEHLGQCASCRNELAKLRHAHAMLQSAASQSEEDRSTRVSVATISNQAMWRLERNRRRWRWLSAGLGTALAAMLVLYVFSIRIEFHQSHVVIRWNDESQLAPAPRPTDNLQRVQTQLVDHRLRIDDLDKTIQLLIQLTSEDERQRDREALLFAKQIQSLRTQNDTRWRTISYVMGKLQPSFDDQSSVSNKTLSGERP